MFFILSPYIWEGMKLRKIVFFIFIIFSANAVFADSVFFVKTIDGTSQFSFSIAATGDFTIDWGDGNIENISQTDVKATTYSHVYKNAGVYDIGMSGVATAYNTNTNVATISFEENKNLAQISGSLSDIFGTLTVGKQRNPRFYRTFQRCENLQGNIPENLFSSLSGEWVPYMFVGTFKFAANLKSTLPPNLFGSISGQPQPFMFWETFNNSGVYGDVPPDLFAGAIGTPVESMFRSVFFNCTGLTGTIPKNLFAGISGPPADSMFAYTFKDCANLTGTIPEDLFAGISGRPINSMFLETFCGCSKLTGPIPEYLFVGISGNPATSMFQGTFRGCSKLTGPISEILFAGISGRPANKMFQETFYGASGLTGDVPQRLFANVDINYTASNQMTNVFYGTKLNTQCNAGDYQFITGFEKYFTNRVACTKCPNGTTSDIGATKINECFVLCERGYYLPANSTDCSICPANSWCRGGKMSVDENNASGVNACLTGLVCPAGSSQELSCGRLLHVGNTTMYMSQIKNTEHALVVEYDGKRFYTNASTEPHFISDDSKNVLKIKYNNQIYWIYSSDIN